MLNKRLINTGVEAAPAAFDPLQNFETVTYTGNGGTQKITGYIRKGAAFNGSSSKIDLILSPNDIVTVSFWFNCTSSTGVFFAAGDSGSYPWLAILLAAGKITAEYTGNIGGGLDGSSSITNSTYNDGNWHHVACVFTGTYGVNQPVTIYVDGVSDTADTGDSFTGLITTLNGNSAIGYYKAQSILFLDGKLDQVRIFDKALSSSEVTTLYGETYASSTKSTTDIFNDGSGVALYELDEDADDTGKGAIDSGQSAVFNGSSSKIETSLTQTNTSAWSWSFWVNVSSKPSSGNIAAILSNMNGSSPFAGVAFLIDSPNFGFASGGSGIWTSNIVNPNLNQWYHIVITYDGTNTITPYVDGTSYGAITHTPANGNNLTIGDSDLSSWGSFNGKIDQVRIYSSALSSSDVTNLYNESSVPTTNLVAHYKLDGNATDEQGSYDGTETSITYSDPAEYPVYNGTPTNVNFLGMAFQPDLVWTKSRSTTGSSHTLYDSVRGVSKFLLSNATNAENNGTSNTGGVTSFNSNGFDITLDSFFNLNNYPGRTYVAWCWKAGGAAVSNTDGTITSQVSVNQDAGFSIVKYTGTGANATVGHGLSSKPQLIIAKTTNQSYNWVVYAEPITAEKNLILNSTSAEIDSTTFMNDTEPTSTVFTAGAGNNLNYANGDEIIAYCFHSVGGYQKVGSYTGTGSTGNTITTGFQPRFVMIKSTTASNTSWVMIDSLRDNADEWLYANESSATFDDANTYTQLNSNGFTVNLTASYVNAPGHTYIYLAIA